MSLRSVAKALGGDVIGPARILAPGPGHSRSDRSMSVLIDPSARDGFVVSSFAGDDWRQCRDHVRGMLGAEYRTSAQAAVATAAPVERKAAAAGIWTQSLPIRGTLVETYLVNRGLSLPAEVYDGRALRFHPSCPFRLNAAEFARLPAMIAAMVDIRTNEFRGVHRTALAADGFGKAVVPGLGNPRKMLGQAAGACVKLAADEDVTLGLHVTEGIETALACMAMGFRPVWAALSAGAIARFPVLDGIEALTIFGDRDATGEAAALTCSARWRSAGKEVITILPADEGSDFADGRRS
jgi:hypothetical protein